MAKLFSTIINSSLILFLACAALPSQVLSAGTPPSIPKTSLASTPPYAEQIGDKPAVVLGLSVEFPAVGALYRDTAAYGNTDMSYSNSNEYIGYFDTESCYTYINNPTEIPSPGQILEDYRRFQRSGAATNRMCTNAFSGNFLNWAASSAIDTLRIALTGGDRLIDRDNLTIVQRAVIPDGIPICFWNSINFPGKKLSKAGGASGKAYFGAVPIAMQTAAGTNDIWVANTLNKIFFGTDIISYGNCAYTTTYTLGTFYARVEVCNSSSGILQDNRNYPLCKKYPSGHYKPIGALQKYSDKVRISVFSFLLDHSPSWNNGRYGGILRAPMKYVGQKTFDENGIENTPSAGNTKSEWNETTGIFTPNPESDASGISGVINYINKFGRTGTIPGNYKHHDPSGEMHYEALRYLQGLEPSPDAISNIAPGMDDGFPVYTTWTDPYGGSRSNTSDYSCRSSNILIFGDDWVNDGVRLPTPDPVKNIPDINAWRTVVQSFEKGDATSYTDGQGIVRTTQNPNPPNPNVVTNPQRSQIMGTAYWANTHDIRGMQWDNILKRRPGLRVKTFIYDVNEFGLQNDLSRMKNTNQLFTAAKYGGFKTKPYSENDFSYNTQGNPFYRDDGITDPFVWEDTDPSTSRVGLANTYFKQEDGKSVITSMDEIFRRFTVKRQIIAGAATQSKSLTSNGTLLFLGSFNSERWSGDVRALPVVVDPNTPTSVTIQPTEKWSAGRRLRQLNNPVENRNIVVGISGATANPTATDFTWSAIDPNLQIALSKATPSSPEDSQGPDRLNYLRGDRSKESSGVFRHRTGLLGDIINSGIVYSGAPTKKIVEDGYPAFQASMASRTTAVFVGANDGMLHAFNAENGSELFAYIPSWIAPRLPALAQLDYVDNHQSFVDSTPEVAEAKVGANWKTVLVSGTGNGGRGVFALDVSDPSAFNTSKVMWEFTQQDDPDMGNVVGTPRILRFRTSAPNSQTMTYKWFAVVASGVNNYTADSSGIIGSGYPALFLLDLSKGKGTAWSKGTNYYKISIPVNGNLDYINTYSQTGGTALTATQATGLVNFSYALGGAREVEYMFMGDLHGKLWKLDFTGVGSADWDINGLSAFKAGSKPYPLYVAKDSSGTAQPITAAPMIANGPMPKSHYILFGTGSYLTVSDQLLTTPQSVYMVYDYANSPADTTSSSPASAIKDRKRLEAGTASAGGVSVPPFTLGRAMKNNDPVRSGWYFDLPSSGERVISSLIFSGETAIFSTMIPIINTTTGKCIPDNGSGNTYDVRIAGGNGSFTASTVGLMAPPVQFNLTDAITYPGSTQKTNNNGRRLRVIPTKKIQIGTLGTAVISGQDKKEVAGRLNWRQINNFQDLKNKP